ncbi:MAG: hypothetical protein GX456_00915 [Verrucomicrobia bacterium]|nr:hypothetical protein [Verrucomicrobiota bacterium]
MSADSVVPVPKEREDLATVEPWRIVRLDPDYSGAWVVAGDLDKDGAVEIVSARNVDNNDVHYTSAVVAQRLDGTLLWRWGDPRIGRKKLHHDVACQIYDWDGDGRNEVVLCTEGFLIELNGATGIEKRRIHIPKDATDCIVFANLSGSARATDVLIKTRYTQIWAFDRSGKQLWTARNPGGFLTAHQPVPIDLDGDGRDEVMAGYAMLNPDGTVRWLTKTTKIDQARGHCDCFRLVRSGHKPDQFRFAMTFCGANGIALIDGNGHSLWEVTGEHFESIDVGKICPEIPGLQIAVDIDHRPWGAGPVWVFDENGNVRTKINTDYARHHALLDWTGDGIHEIVVAQSRAIFDCTGKRIATLAMDAADDAAGEERLVLTGDFTGDGVPDVLLTKRSMSAVHIYKNLHGQKPSPPAPLGTEANFTLY